jgi:hypothetical protein
MLFLKDSLVYSMKAPGYLHRFPKHERVHGIFGDVHQRPRRNSFTGLDGSHNRSAAFAQFRKKGSEMPIIIGHLFYRNRKPSIQGVIKCVFTNTN